MKTTPNGITRSEVEQAFEFAFKDKLVMDTQEFLHSYQAEIDDTPKFMTMPIGTKAHIVKILLLHKLKIIKQFFKGKKRVVFKSRKIEARASTENTILRATGKCYAESPDDALTDEQVKLFEHYGVIPAIKLQSLDSDEINRIKESVVDTLSNLEFEEGFTPYLHLVNKDVLDLAYNPEIIHKVQSLLGEDITLSNALSFIKKPHTGVTTKWHNAPPSTFGGVYDREDEGINQVTVWISLSDTKQDNGAMKIVPRSFLGDILEDIIVSRHHIDRDKEYLDIDQNFLYQRAAKNSRYRHSGSIMGTPNQYFDLSQNIMGIGLREGYIREIIEKHKMNAYKLEAEPGEFYMFSSRNIHCAFPNSSDRTRVAIAFRYLSNSNMRGVRPINESPSFEKAKEHPIFKMILDGLGISSQRQEPLLVLCAGKAQAQLEKFYIDIENIRAQQSKVEQKWSPDLRQ